MPPRGPRLAPPAAFSRRTLTHELRELIEVHRDTMGPESAAALASRICAAQAVLDFEALGRIENP